MSAIRILILAGLVMLGLAGDTGEGLDTAHRCARHLLEHAEGAEPGLSWPPERRAEAVANFTGFAHGAAGIGWALVVLGAATGREDYVEAGRRAFAYEASHFDHEQEDWHDLRRSVLEMGGAEYMVRGLGYLRSLDDLRNVPVATKNGTPVLVRDVATVSFGPDIRRGAAEWQGEGETVAGIVVMRDGMNALKVIHGVKQKLAGLAKGEEVFWSVGEVTTSNQFDLPERGGVRQQVVDEITRLVKGLQDSTTALEKSLAHHGGSGLVEEAKHYCHQVLPGMNKVREFADKLEGYVADDLWPLPTYQEMLFIK